MDNTIRALGNQRKRNAKEGLTMRNDYYRVPFGFDYCRKLAESVLL